MNAKEKYDNFIKFLENKRTYIHCETEEESNLLLSKLHELGFKWRGGNRLNSRSFYERYREKTAYCMNESPLYLTKLSVAYAKVDWVVLNGYEVFKFKDIVMDLQELNAEMLLNGEL